MFGVNQLLIVNQILNKMNISYQVSEVKLTYETKIKQSERFKITSSKDIFLLMLKNWVLEQIEHRETFKIILLNQRNEVLGIYTVAEGGIAEISIDVRLILQAALLANASGIILVHNHPSGSVTPSNQDKVFTQQVSKAAKLMQITVIDHIILCRDNYYSFGDEGALN